jgi:hypothetical protein
VTLKFSDYAKLEYMKHLVLAQLSDMGLKEQVRVMSDTEVNSIITMIGLLAVELQALQSDEERMNKLVSYVVKLWVKLLIDYGASPKELGN